MARKQSKPQKELPVIAFLNNLDPNPKQLDFWMAKNRHIAYGGSRGGGKSWAMRTKCILLCENYDGLKVLLLRRTLPELRENHILPLMQILDGHAKYNNDEKAFTFPNGSRLKLGYCDTDADVYQYQGQEYDVVCFEEATLFTEFQIQFILTCNRSTRDDFKPRAYYTCNPGGPSHQHIKRLFIDQEYREKEKPEDYSFIAARVYDNHVLMRTNPEYVQTLENLPEDQRRAFLDGDWDVFAGQYFREFRRDKHVIPQFTPPASWRKWRSIDYGYNDPSAIYWHCADSDGHVYTYRELYIKQTAASEQARLICELSENEEISYTVASPDMWQKRGAGVGSGESIAETFFKYGVPLKKADNARILGWHRMHEYLAVAPDEKPYWMITENCKNLIRTLPALVHDEHNVEDVSDKVEDHGPESCRYSLMSRPRPNAPEEQQMTGTWHYDELRMKGYTDSQIRRMRGVKIIGGKKK